VVAVQAHRVRVFTFGVMLVQTPFISSSPSVHLGPPAHVRQIMPPTFGEVAVLRARAGLPRDRPVIRCVRQRICTNNGSDAVRGAQTPPAMRQ